MVNDKEFETAVTAMVNLAKLRSENALVIKEEKCPFTKEQLEYINKRFGLCPRRVLQSIPEFAVVKLTNNIYGHTYELNSPIIALGNGQAFGKQSKCKKWKMGSTIPQIEKEHNPYIPCNDEEMRIVIEKYLKYKQDPSGCCQEEEYEEEDPE